MAVRLEREGAVGVIVLDRPPANSYDYDFLRELGAAIDDARFDEAVRALVVASASEKFFSAGADLKSFQAGSARQRAATTVLGHEVFRKLENTPMVIVAAVAGFTAPLDLGLAIEREAIAHIFVSEDAEEGIRAFNEKRPPKYTGR